MYFNTYYRHCLTLLSYKIIAYIIGVNSWQNLENNYTNNDRFFFIFHFRLVYETEQFVPFWLFEKLAKKQRKKLWMKFLMPASMIWNLLEESHTAKQMQNALTETFRTEIAIMLICKREGGTTWEITLIPGCSVTSGITVCAHSAGGKGKSIKWIN